MTEGLSKIFRSTKGAATVGFMGIGFKSVFGRFREVRVSGWGWTFRYDVSQVVGAIYSDVQLDLLGAVIPIWDDSIAAPQRIATRAVKAVSRAKRGRSGIDEARSALSVRVASRTIAPRRPLQSTRIWTPSMTLAMATRFG